MAQQKNENNGAPQQDLNQLLKVRREKLQDLQANGKDPFVITKFDVTNHSVEIKEQYDELEEDYNNLRDRYDNEIGWCEEDA